MESLSCTPGLSFLDNSVVGRGSWPRDRLVVEILTFLRQRVLFFQADPWSFSHLWSLIGRRKTHDHRALSPALEQDNQNAL
jgi:hypothetical protein